MYHPHGTEAYVMVTDRVHNAANTGCKLHTALTRLRHLMMAMVIFPVRTALDTTRMTMMMASIN